MSIHYCITGALECTNIMFSRNGSNNMAFKTDIGKAFDTMGWDFLISVLKGFRFSELFCDWILHILQFARISIPQGGSEKGYFHYERVVMMGDLLSSLLFCLGEDYLSRSLENFVRQRCLLCYAERQHCFSISFSLCGRDFTFSERE